MHISAIQNHNVTFGRRLTERGQNELSRLETQAKQKLGTGMTTATIFDFSVPKSKNDTGIGTSFSNDAQEMAAFLKTVCGVNSIQLQPQGQISNLVRSPYSGTSFSLGMHIIDLNRLTEKDYGYLLTEDDFDTPLVNKKHGDKVDYDSIFAENGQKAMLQKAYDNFVELSDNSTLKKEFETFKQDNKYWLEKDALFEAAEIGRASCRERV